MIDKKLIGHEFNPITLPVEEGRLKFVAKAIGETNPVYSDLDAAKAEGHPSLLAPPTFVFMLEIDALNLDEIMKLFGKDVLNLKLDKNKKTYWTLKKKIPSKMKDQF